jgi:hypothetical protein
MGGVAKTVKEFGAQAAGPVEAEVFDFGGLRLNNISF